ncbi:MAG TPA: hypothetical protein PLO05_06275 [Bacteroidales bacterium]|jgi:hypothetical protein|nr:hypothetical protein [Bacteroidales bacterium]MDY0161298.1 hypothetical protein [Bacteroidales bacterium]HXK81743.1 hypothetical protein [Bacteroidales bacterium]
MKCPNCNSTGNLLKRVFIKRKGLPNRYCVYCNAEVKLIYNWRKIFLLALIIIAVLMILHAVMVSVGLPGVSGGIAGGAAGAVLAIFMRKPPYLNIELVKHSNKKRRN